MHDWLYAFSASPHKNPNHLSPKAGDPSTMHRVICPSCCVHERPNSINNCCHEATPPLPAAHPIGDFGGRTINEDANAETVKPHFWCRGVNTAANIETVNPAFWGTVARNLRPQSEKP